LRILEALSQVYSIFCAAGENFEIFCQKDSGLGKKLPGPGPGFLLKIAPGPVFPYKTGKTG